MVVPSLSKPNTWFIFRETGIEVEVVIKNNMLRPTHRLTHEEVKFFKMQILEVGELIINIAV